MSGKISEEDARRLSEQVIRMERLVKNILNLSVLEMERNASNEPVDLHTLLTPLIEDYTMLASSRGIALSIDLAENLVVSGDHERLFRVFSNLLDNAVKYTFDNGQIRVSATVEDNVIVQIYNTCEGISSSDLVRIFEQFYRVEQSRAVRYGGSGLGLAIVKRIVELHGGKITVSSELGKSVTVTVELKKYNSKY